MVYLKQMQMSVTWLKKAQVILVLCMLTASTALFSQTIHDYIAKTSEANTYFNTGNYREAGAKYEEVFALLKRTLW
jgi:predicted S18 family serine protease